ncbi:Hemicentin-2-like 4, partial [Homarus americanus]
MCFLNYCRNSQAELNLIVSTNISPGSPRDSCPSGFTLDKSGPYCRDNDECVTSTSRCSHGCTNTVGSYFCTCTPGYTLGPDGYMCQNINECQQQPDVCDQTCLNLIGGYRCDCRRGFRLVGQSRC